jgi:hypothetical protein
VVDDLTKGATRELVQEREEPGAGWVNIDHSVPYWLGCGRASSSASASAAAAAITSSSDVAGSSARHFLWSSEHPSGFLALTLHDRSGKRLRVLHDAEAVMYHTTVFSSRGHWTTSKDEAEQHWGLDCNCCCFQRGGWHLCNMECRTDEERAVQFCLPCSRSSRVHRAVALLLHDPCCRCHQRRARMASEF